MADEVFGFDEDEELSLPLFPELTREEQDRVIAAVRAWAASDSTAT